MQSLEQLPVLRVGEDVISLEQSLKYLQLSGNLLPVVQDVVSQHIVYQELQARKDSYQISGADIAQSMVDFRCRQQLTDAAAFEAWLQSQGLDQTLFQQRIAMNLLLKQLKSDIAAADLQTVFEQQRFALEMVALEGLICADGDMADALHQRLQAGEPLAAVSSSGLESGTALVRPVAKSLRRGQMPEPLRNAVADVAAGTLLPPLQMEQYHCLFRVVTVTPAVLEGELKQQLEAKLFQLWVAERIKSLNVRLETGAASLVREPATIA